MENFYSISVNNMIKKDRSLRPTPKQDKFDLYAAMFICNVFLTTQQIFSPSPPNGGDGFNICK